MTTLFVAIMTTIDVRKGALDVDSATVFCLLAILADSLTSLIAIQLWSMI